MFLVKLILAVIAILVIIAFMAGIWKAIFPSEDKASVKSFETFYSLMNSKMASNLPYDSNAYTLYLSKDYRIFYFSSADIYKCPKSSSVYTKPSTCTAGKSCLCLYSDTPIVGDKDKNVIECKTFNNDIAVAEFQLNNDDCTKSADTIYTALIVAEQIKALPTQQSKKIYVWLNTPDNQAMDTKLKAPVCPNTAKNICNGQKQDAILSGPEWYEKVLIECMSQTPAKKTLSATCAFNANLNTCNLKCSDTELQCGDNIKSCRDYENYAEDGSMNARYMIANSSAEWACKNTALVCANAKSCKAEPTTYYYCNKGLSECNDAFNNIDPKYVTSCSIKKEFSIDNGFLISFDQSVIGCNKYIEQTVFSDSTQVYAYDPEVDHESFRTNTTLMAKCGFYANPTGRVVMLTNSSNDCIKAITENLLPIEYCLANP
jgi:hypothetical protein